MCIRDSRGTKRNANVASARRVAIYILREVTGMSMEEIGREFSGRDHSTIVYSLKTMERDMKLSLIHISVTSPHTAAFAMLP